MKNTAANLANVVVGEGLLRVANFLALVVIARLYGAATLGRYAAVLAMATVAAQLADNGIQAGTAATEIGRDVQSIHVLVYQLHAAKATLIAPTLIVLALAAPYLLPGRKLGLLGALVVARTALQQFGQLNLAIIKALDRMKCIAPIQAGHFTFLVAGITTVYRNGLSVYWLFVWLLAGQLLEILLSGWKLWEFGIRPAPCSFRECLRLAKRSTPVGITYSIANLIVRMDVIVVSVVGISSAVGRFAAGQMLLTFVYALAWMMGSVWLPELVRLAHVGVSSRSFVNKWTALVVLISAPFAAALFVCAGRLVGVLYGPEFVETGATLAILALAIPFILLNALLLNRAIALSETSVFVGVYAATAAVSAGLDFSLLKVWGFSGLASAIVIREAFMFAAFQWLARREPQASFGRATTAVSDL